MLGWFEGSAASSTSGLLSQLVWVDVDDAIVGSIPAIVRIACLGFPDICDSSLFEQIDCYLYPLFIIHCPHIHRYLKDLGSDSFLHQHDRGIDDKTTEPEAGKEAVSGQGALPGAIRPASTLHNQDTMQARNTQSNPNFRPSGSGLLKAVFR